MKILKYIGNWKYRYFLKKLSGVQKMIADWEFKLFKTREVREEVRQEYEALQSRLHVLEQQILAEKEKPSLKEEEAKKLDDDKALIERDMERRIENMKALDLEIGGSRPTKDYPEGVQGINDQIDALRELLGMIQEYLKII